MLERLNNKLDFVSSQQEINDFVDSNENTLKILSSMEPHLLKYFPQSRFSLEICDSLGWTTETKLLLNVHVNEEIFFNGMLSHFNEIYLEIEPVIGDMENTVVLFPEINGKKYDKLSNNSAINLIARTAYFNNYNNGIIQREMSFREIPKSQQVEEIIE